VCIFSSSLEAVCDEVKYICGGCINIEYIELSNVTEETQCEKAMKAIIDIHHINNRLLAFSLLYLRPLAVSGF
jgi:hypothetical protein